MKTETAHKTPVYKSKELLGRAKAAAVLLGVTAVAAACGNVVKANHQKGQGPMERSADATLCTPVLRRGQEPPKINLDPNFKWDSKAQELGIETAVEAYEKQDQIVNAMIDIPLGANGFDGYYFKQWPMDTAPSIKPDVNAFKSMSQYSETPTDQLYYGIALPGCVNVNGEYWIIVNTLRVFPEYSQDAISPKAASNDWRDIWSFTAWIKAADVNKIPGVRIYNYKSSGNRRVIKGHYGYVVGPNGEKTLGSLHFPGVADNAYGIVTPIDKSSEKAIYQNSNQISDLQQFMLGR